MVDELIRQAEYIVTTALTTVNTLKAAAALKTAEQRAVDIADLRRALLSTKALSVKLEAFQAETAAAVAAVERHGDGGAGLLSRSVGRSQRDARGQIKTAEAIKEMPAVLEAVQNGKITFANAKHLTAVGGNTSPQAVQTDTELLRMAEALPPGQFGRQARKWAAQHRQDNGEAAYQRLRARRSLRIWNADDGMVHIKGEFDPATGERIRNRLTKHAARLRKHDKQNTPTGQSGVGRSRGTGQSGVGRSRPSRQRSFQQCMADAFDALTVASISGNGGTAGTAPVADIAVVQHLDADTEAVVAEIAGGEPLPASVLDQLMCNASLTGLLFSTAGVPLWRGRSVRCATPAQMKTLIVKYGNCIGCGAHPSMCQGHHIEPVSQGGATDIDNMTIVCWECHNNIHHHNWQITNQNGHLALQPPDSTQLQHAQYPHHNALPDKTTRRRPDPKLRPPKPPPHLAHPPQKLLLV